MAALLLAPENFKEASEALLELTRRDQQLAREVAAKILNERVVDIFYRAHAFEVLYAVALDAAIDYIESHASTESAYVLGAMIGSVTDDAGIMEGRDKILEAVSMLREAVNTRPPEELDSIAQTIARFEEVYE